MKKETHRSLKSCGCQTRTDDIMINSHALLPTELIRNNIKLGSPSFNNIVRTGFEPVLPP